MTTSRTYIGLDLGGTNVKVAAFSEKGERIAERIVPTLDDGTRGWLDRARVVIEDLRSACGGDARLGVAAPGFIAPDGFSVAAMPERLPGLEGLNWQEWLGLDHRVPVLNDAKAALLGEVWLGAAKGSRNVVLLTLGTGVGGAAMVDGRLLHGHIGRAGHLGHTSLDPDGVPDIVGAPGSLEDAIGDCTVERRTRGRFQATRDLVAAYEAGTPEAVQAWLTSVRALAAALAGFVNILDPEVIVIGGGIAEAGTALFQPLREHLDRFEWRPTGNGVRVIKAALGRFSGAAGAAYHARELAGS